MQQVAAGEVIAFADAFKEEDEEDFRHRRLLKLWSSRQRSGCGVEEAGLPCSGTLQLPAEVVGVQQVAAGEVIAFADAFKEDALARARRSSSSRLEQADMVC